MTFNLPRRLTATATLTALAAALALPALAQTATPAAGTAVTTSAAAVDNTAPAAVRTPGEQAQKHQRHGHAQAKHQHDRKGMHKDMKKDRGERHARHHSALQAKLQLTPAQESAWTTYTAALQPGERPARLERTDMRQLTTPERIDRMRAMRAQHAAEADRRGEATKSFYAVLSPEQQKTFDAQSMRGPGERHHGQDRKGARSGDRDHHRGDKAAHARHHQPAAVPQPSHGAVAPAVPPAGATAPAASAAQ